jgi:5-methylcytosine-specific restriction endonuclease McrA
MKEQLKVLKRLGAPAELIASFEEVCSINSHLPVDMKSSFSDLLENQCRKFGFHEILPEGWFFRPYLLGEDYQRKDTAAFEPETEAPTIEQAYRRGYVQGYVKCRTLVQDGNALKQLVKEEDELQRWRVRPVQCFGSSPGSKERPPRKLFGGRSSFSHRLRYKVFERDKFRCVVCGRKASDYLTLEVDHITPVAKGGYESLDNLRTLCFECNRGKSDS